MFPTKAIQEEFIITLFAIFFTENALDFDSEVIKLGKVYYERGVRGNDYGLIGDILFWTLSFSLGSAYENATHSSWVKLYSRFLKAMIPFCVKHEMELHQSAFQVIKNIFVQQESVTSPTPDPSQFNWFVKNYKRVAPTDASSISATSSGITSPMGSVLSDSNFATPAMTARGDRKSH